MVKQQAEALRLADELATCVQHGLNSHSLMEDAAAELRRLHGENVAQRKALRTYISTIDQFHHAVADAGWHPGRTDDLLTDIIREKGKEMRRLHNVNKELLAVLEEAEYALDYAADMTKPEGLSGCDCPICTASIRIGEALAGKRRQA